MSEALTHKFTYTTDEYMNAMDIWYRRDRRRYLIIAAVCAVSLCLFFAFPSVDAIFLTIFYVSVVVVAAFVIRPLLLKRNFRQSRIWQAEQDFSFNQDGIRIETEFSTTELKWKFFPEIWDTENAYLLFVEKRKFLIIPKRIFRGVDEQLSFEELVHAEIPNTKLLSHGEK
ncbi:hypothetical protein BH10CYA1_BH10CYA1_08290 [soil metagenome]